MIHDVDEILRDLIQSRIAALAGLSQVGFEPPDDNWRKSLVTADEERVNLYLYEMREDLKLRTNERTRVPENGWYRETQPPVRVDCHYLVTAWSNVTFSPPMSEPTLDEHTLLYAVLDVLLRNRPLEPARVYQGFQMPSQRNINSVPPELRNEQLPLDAAFPEGLKDQGDFWSTMKMTWKPSIELVVTVPALLVQDEIETPMVTSLVADYLPAQAEAEAEEWITVGGYVLAGNKAAAVAGAWVQIVGLAPQQVQAVNRRTLSQGDGTFVFGGLRPGQYHLRAVAQAVGSIGRDVDLPSETGEYDLRIP